jgi:nucleotide-binding universal stress UspA family protein
MAVKDILVVLDHSQHRTALLDLAIGLAERHSARLTGLHVVAHHFFETKHSETAVKAAMVKTEFGEMTGRAGIAALWFDTDVNVNEVAVAEIVNRHACYADLVVIGQDEQAPLDRSVPYGLPERVILGSGRPVLVIPYAGSHLDVGERVMLTWKADRESTRAVNDALPLLKKAGEVSVIEVNPTADDDTNAKRLCDHLAAHGVTARMEPITAVGISIGDALLNRVPVEGCNLLVMGADSRTSLGTLTLGEVEKHILKYMTVPVLMSR